LECWDGLGSFTFDRIARGTVRIDPACLTVLGGIQPGPLGEYLRAAVRGGAGDDGLVQRFQLAVYPDVPPHWRNVDRPPDEAAVQKVDELFRACSKIDPIAIGATEWSRGLHALHFSPEAQAIFDDWRARLEIRLRSGEEAPIFMAHLGKYKSLVPALATIFHVADVVMGEAAPGPISAAAVNLGIRWAVFLEEHARRVYGLALARGEAAAKGLSKKLLARALPTPFTAREVYHRGWAGLTDPDEVREGLELLEDLGWVASEPGTKSAKGGRPSLRYFPNPAIWGFKPGPPVTRKDLKQPPLGADETAKTPLDLPQPPGAGAVKTDRTGSGGFGSPQGDESRTKITDDGFEEELL
jgi:putative DNA primase/helicase